MSRVGKKPIEIPAGVTVTIEENNLVTVKGPKGELKNKFNENINIAQEDNTITISCENVELMPIFGTTRALLNNMVVGVNSNFSKELQIVGVGYKAQLKGKAISLNLGYSHVIDMDIPEGINVELPNQTTIVVSGIDKQVVGEFAANIRAKRKPEPYKGKGVRYKDERIIRKEGKSAK